MIQKLLYLTFSHDFHQGERIGILGKNGVENLLLNILTDSIDIDKGRIERADTLRIGYYSPAYDISPAYQRVIDYAKSRLDDDW